MTAKNYAKQIYDDIYIDLMFSDTDRGEEILVSILARKLSIRSVNLVLSANPHSNPFNTDRHSTMPFWLQVRTELESF